MDLVTQGLLGAGIGQAFFAKRLKRKAIVIGALAGLLPDFDIFYGESTLNFLKYHRGYTHALFFDILAGILFGLLSYGIYRLYAPQVRPVFRSDDTPTLWTWIGLFILAFITHPLLDLFTSYGTQLAQPFSDKRFALNAVAVVDPLYSLIFVISLIWGWRLIAKGRERKAQKIGLYALFLSTLYLFAGLALNNALEERAERSLKEHISTQGENDRYEKGMGLKWRITAFPLLFQPFYRTIVAQTPIKEDAQGAKIQITKLAFVTYLSKKPLKWYTFKDQVTVSLKDFGRLGQIFMWFCDDQLRVREIPQQDGRLLVQLLDLRYATPEQPGETFWALQAYFKDGKPVSEPEFVRLGGSFKGKSVREIWERGVHEFSYLWRQALGDID